MLYKNMSLKNSRLIIKIARKKQDYVISVNEKLNQFNIFFSEYANAELLSADDIEDPPSLFFEQRLVYAMYYFHYYNNIFLLAAMSVERSIAVMKSLRCQRYNFKVSENKQINNWRNKGALMKR